ncbi:hypothetical protein [Desulforamulus ruminis]|uniref:Copper amine oxidase domain-containing protein n=1 Tax=Desulforamulus ruminis (strain ATCC 23193 / DSM 2154 / NCIMB 8452 / DL) TaxID=696281 RepID=F6DRX3_DESRL|nr:hypothetical protein [Desulforamulus ruminis]AEG60997.1 copper amine oxidase domain-containing protein [Desulforamulus ruminis DSM 2154]
MKKSCLIIAVTIISILTMCATAFGYSNNLISEVVSVPLSSENVELGTITIQEDSAFSNDFVDGNIFIISLPNSLSFDQDKTIIEDAEYRYVTNSRIEITMTNTTPSVDTIAIHPVINILPKAEAGDFRVKIDGRDSAVTTGEYLILRLLP